MPIYNNRKDPNSWYNTIPTQPRVPKLHPFLDRQVDVDDLEEDIYVQSDGTTFAKIPKIQGRISRRNPSDRNETYIDFLISEHKDEATGQWRKDKVIIGMDLGSFATGRMIVNDNYFDRYGDLINASLGQQREERAREKEERKRAAEEAKAKKNTQKEIDLQTPNTKPINTETTSTKTVNIEIANIETASTETTNTTTKTT